MVLFSHQVRGFENTKAVSGSPQGHFQPKQELFPGGKKKSALELSLMRKSLILMLKFAMAVIFYVNGDTDLLKSNSNRFAQAPIPAWKRPFHLVTF